MEAQPGVPWRERLNAAESTRATAASYWMTTLPKIFAECLVPAAREFQAAVTVHVMTRLMEMPAEHKVVLLFDDWHLGEWPLVVQLVASTSQEAAVQVTYPEGAPFCVTLQQQGTWSEVMFLDLITDAYVARITSQR